MLAGDDVDDARNGIGTVECTRRSFYNFYLLDVLRVDETQVVLAAVVAVQTTTVDEDEHVAVA